MPVDDSNSSNPKEKVLYWCNFLLCAAGTVAIFLFAVNLEQHDSWAYHGMQIFLRHSTAVIGGLFAGMAALVVLFFVKGKS